MRQLKRRQGDLAVGILFVLVVLSAYKVLILSPSRPTEGPSASPSAPLTATPATPAAQTAAASETPSAVPPGRFHGAPRPIHRAPPAGAGAMLFFQDYLRGIVAMSEHGQSLSAAQSAKLLPVLREFTADSRFKLGYYDRFRVAREDIWNALTPQQKTWLQQHRAALGHSHAPPEQAAGAAARLTKSLP